MPEPYTPTMEQIRDSYRSHDVLQAAAAAYDWTERGEEFDRWLSAYTTRIREEALASVLADINREAEKHARHLREGTSVGGESPLWHEACESSMRAAAAIVRVAMSEIPEGQN